MIFEFYYLFYGTSNQYFNNKIYVSVNGTNEMIIILLLYSTRLEIIIKL